MTFKVRTMSFWAEKRGVDGDDGRFEMTLKINKGDITRWFIDGFSDAIVNSTGRSMHALGGMVNRAVHKAAGPELQETCCRIPEIRPGVRCPMGEARITPGFELPASHVIHAVGPAYGFDISPEAALRSVYMNSLRVAKANNIQYIAFPAISCGLHCYPYEEAATVAISTVKEFGNEFKEVHFVLFPDDVYNVWVKKAKQLLQA